MFDISIYLSLIAYAALVVLMTVQIRKDGRRAESVGWLMFGAHGFIMILFFIVDNTDGIIDAEFYNIWSNSVHLQGMATLLATEITRYLRIRGKNHG